MAETKWTKGPWVLDDTGCIGSKRPTRYIKCTSPWIEGAFKDDAEMLANQRLMAAAPELYEALEAAEGHLADDLNNTALHPVGDCPVLWKVRAALAKVRGDG